MPAISAPTLEEQGVVILDTHYHSQTFRHKSVLSSQQLMDFQSGYQKALRSLASSFSTNGDWGIVDSQTTHLDAIFTEDVNTGNYYSHGDSARHSSKTPDFPVYFTDVAGDRIYFGHKYPFTSLAFVFSIAAGSSISPTWQYWNNSWTSVSGLSDGTNGFTSNGTVSWTESQDWVMDSLDNILSLSSTNSIDIENRFWSRVQIGSTQTFTISTVQRTAYNNELLVRANSTPNTSVQVCPGIAMIGGRIVRVKDYTQVSCSSYFPISTARYLIIQLNHDGELSVKASADETSPIEPEADFNSIKLCKIYLNSADTTIVNGDIDNNRQFLNP